MKKIFRQAFSILLSFVIVFASVAPSYAANNYDSIVEIKLVPGNNKITINGKAYQSEKPYVEKGVLFVPLRLIVEAFGAEVIWKGDNRINVVYRDVSADLTIGETKYSVNQAQKVLPVAPVSVNQTTMVPVQFIIENFGVAVSSDPFSKVTTILLEDDGALSDLSFLTGSISKSQAGDSYFGWSMNIPKGSRLRSLSFNSRHVLIENEQRGISLEISIDVDKGKSLKSYFNDVMKNPLAFFECKSLDSYLNTDANPEYAEFSYTNFYDEAVLRRVFVSKGCIYNVVLTSYNESDPRKLKDNAYYSGIMDSFKLSYPTGSRDIQDLSKVNFGLSKFENYITLESGKKFFTWELSVLPEWDVLEPDSINRFRTKIGASEKEYISIEISKAEDVEDVGEYVNKVKAYYDTNFNAKFYKLIESKDGMTAGYKSNRLIYSVKAGKKTYIYDESYIISGSLVYCVTIKAPQEKYEKQSMSYYSMLETLNLSSNDTTELEANIDKHNYSIDRNRLAKDDTVTLYENKAYGWSIKMPGYWVKSNIDDEAMQFFTNYNTGAIIYIEAVEETQLTKGLSDMDKFRLMGYVTANNANFEGMDILRQKGGNVRLYKFRIENEEQDMYASMKFYVVSKGKYSYCYMSAISDLCTSEKNIEEMQEIWDSFTPVGK